MISGMTVLSRLVLGAADFGKILGVSAHSINDWESEKACSRDEQIAKLAALRGLGKREVAARLEEYGTGGDEGLDQIEELKSSTVRKWTCKRKRLPHAIGHLQFSRCCRN